MSTIVIAPNLLLYIAIGAAALLVGLSKGGLGGTVGVLVTPLLALALPADAALGVSLPLLLIGDGFAVWMYWRCWDGPLIWRLMPSVIAGVVIGSLLLPILSPAAIRIAISVLALVYCVYKLFERTLRRDLAQSDPKPWHTPIFGACTGVASTVANAGGPIISVYFLMQHISPVGFMGTSALFYLLINSMKIPGFLLAGLLRPQVFVEILWALPLIPLGVWAGRLLITRWRAETFERVILILLALSALFLLTR
jgi:uncharacterized membrane protein YfcA